MECHENLSNASFHAIKAQAVFSDTYRFFDVAIAMKSDQKEPLDWFRQLYPRFRVEKANPKVDATYYMMVQAPKVPLVIAEENSRRKVKALNDGDAVAFYAHLFACNSIATHLKSHFLLHGAVLSWNGDGVAIVGDSCAGKTTLTLELLFRGGFRFLSDDQFAINRTTHHIDPFPRSIGIRESALALFENLELEHLEPQTIIGGQRKWFVDIAEIAQDGIGEPCRLKSLVFLVNSFDESESGKKREQRMELIVDCVNDELLEKLKAVAKHEEIQSIRGRNCYVLSFLTEAEAISVLELEALCQSCGVWLLNVRKNRNLIQPNFHATPMLQKIPRSVAVFELLEALSSDCRAKPCQTYMELAQVLANVACYRLSVGRLDEMARLICDWVVP